MKPDFCKKKLAARIWAKWAKIGPETRFFANASSLVHYFFLKLYTMIACTLQHCLTSSTGKVHKKIFRPQIWAKGVKIGPETRFFAIYSSLFH